MRQTDSTIASIRGWGCYICCLAWMAGVRDIAIVDRVFPRLVKMGLVRDNNIPINKAGWWRSFVLHAPEVIHEFGAELGQKLRARELGRKDRDPQATSTIAGFFVVVYTGGHFGIVHPEVYNPDPRIKLTGREWRVWAVGKAI